MAFENYPTPPIQEAVFDIFVTLPAEIDSEKLSSFGDRVKSGFPQASPRVQVVADFHHDLKDSSKSKAATSASQLGFIYRSEKGEKAVQARFDGFTFNRLPVYEGWDAFSGEAKALWGTYKEVALPVNVTKIGLRYINRVYAPLPFNDFRDYCVLFPDLPKGMTPFLDNFLMRFGGPSVNAPGAMSAITVTFDPPPPNTAVVALILDVSVTLQLPQISPNDDATLWPAFDLLRKEKNILFEASLTDAARNLFRK